jgi:hypothetical protein
LAPAWLSGSGTGLPIEQALRSLCRADHEPISPPRRCGVVGSADAAELATCRPGGASRAICRLLLRNHLGRRKMPRRLAAQGGTALQGEPQRPRRRVLAAGVSWLDPEISRPASGRKRCLCQGLRKDPRCRGTEGSRYHTAPVSFGWERRTRSCVDRFSTGARPGFSSLADCILSFLRAAAPWPFPTPPAVRPSTNRPRRVHECGKSYLRCTKTTRMFVPRGIGVSKSRNAVRTRGHEPPRVCRRLKVVSHAALFAQAPATAACRYAGLPKPITGPCV